MVFPLYRCAILSVVGIFLLIDAAPCEAQGYTVGGARPSQVPKLKLGAELATSDGKSEAVLPKFGLAVPLNPSLEFGFDAQFRHIDQRGAQGISGLGDVELKAKYLLLDGRSNAARIDMSAELKISLPLGNADRGLGDGLNRPGIAGGPNS